LKFKDGNNEKTLDEGQMFELFC